MCESFRDDTDEVFVSHAIVRDAPRDYNRPAMPPISTARRYLLAAVIVLLTLLTRSLMAPLWETTTPFALFMLATVAAAWSGGRGPALLVSLAAVAIRLHSDALPQPGTPPGWEEGARMVLFAGFVAGTIVTVERLRFNARQLEGALVRARREIAERDRTEQALRATERDLRRALDERMQMESQLVAARMKAEETNRLKDEFLAMVSHELRTPLNAILGWAALLRGRALTPLRIGHALDVIDRNAKHQARLVGDLLDVARSLSGSLHLECAPVDLAAVLDGALSSISGLAAARSVRCLPSIAERPLPIWGDAARLEQVVTNLLSNAVKFTPPGGSVELVADRIGHSVRLTVTDTGAGIAPEFLPRVFDHFSQADTGSCRAQGGLGLGLTIVRQLIELHRGTVEVESEGEARGTRFTVLLPLHTADRDPADLPRGDFLAALEPSPAGAGRQGPPPQPQ